MDGRRCHGMEMKSLDCPNVHRELTKERREERKKKKEAGASTRVSVSTCDKRRFYAT
jgi:hypothetical protein